VSAASYWAVCVQERDLGLVFLAMFLFTDSSASLLLLSWDTKNSSWHQPFNLFEFSFLLMS
jgi:hypothetical protein